ncbi:MAG: ATP-binding cassette domain-containing protein [Oscillospiraceae bacterium]|nr:ATP-binding cassette domain-containing protein [Oscillospiraceae bacterium]
MGGIFEDTIKLRKEHDENMYKEAYNDLLSILGVKSSNPSHEFKGAVATILKFLGKEIPEIPEKITEPDAQLEYMIKPSGTMRRRVELVGQWWKDGSGCLLTSKKSGEVLAILPRKWGGYEYSDSKTGQTIRINKDTAKDININAFCFYEAFPLGSLKIKDLLTFMLKNISKFDIVFILLAMAGAQILGMALTNLTSIIYGILIPSGSLPLLFPIASVMIGISISTSLISITQSIIKSKIQSKLSLSVNSAIMIRMFSMPAAFFKDYSSGELASRVGYLATLCQLISDSIFSTFFSLVFSLAYIPQMWFYAPAMVVPGVLTISISILFSTIITFVRQSIDSRKIDLSPKLQALVFSLFGGMQKIKISGAEKRAFSKWAKNYSEVQKLDYSPPWFLKISGVVSTVITALGTVALYYAATKNKVPTHNYFAFNQAYGAVSGSVMALSGIAFKAANLKPIINLIKPFMNAKPESVAGGKILTSLSGNIEIDNLTFRYSKGSPTILNNLSLKINKGEYVAIVGKSGCGKSTLLRLLLGFEKPEVGAIYYDGEDVNNLDLGTLRQKIGVVMQNGSIFPGDIFSNIVVTAPWKTMEDAWQAAEMAGIDQDIKNMPMGMHTLISEGTGGISGGQKQRLMIARAVIGRPSILFLDEATSALDNITQSHVTSGLAKLECTRFTIAHRLSTVKNCDRIIVLDGGKIAEDGTYDELMQKKGKFYSLAIRQVAVE